MLSETLMTVLQNIGGISAVTEKITAWCVEHSIYGMSATLTTASMTPEIVGSIIISSFAIFTVTTIVGILLFRKYEL